MGDLISFVAVYIAGWVAGFFWRRHRASSRKVVLAQWDRLPTGWSKDIGNMVIYAMSVDGQAYWWISRGGKTIIEGPAGSIARARAVAEREAESLLG